jgi:hypothetical protein
MPMFWVSTISMTSTSYVKRLRIRPMGVDSKYDRGASKTLRSIELNAFSAALVPPVTKGGTPKAYEQAISTGRHENESNQKNKTNSYRSTQNYWKRQSRGVSTKGISVTVKWLRSDQRLPENCKDGRDQEYDCIDCEVLVLRRATIRLWWEGRSKHVHGFISP